MTGSAYASHTFGGLAFPGAMLGVGLLYKEAATLHTVINDWLWTMVMLVTLATGVLNFVAAWKRVNRGEAGQEAGFVYWLHRLTVVWKRWPGA